MKLAPHHFTKIISNVFISSVVIKVTTRYQEDGWLLFRFPALAEPPPLLGWCRAVRLRLLRGTGQRGRWQVRGTVRHSRKHVMLPSFQLKIRQGIWTRRTCHWRRETPSEPTECALRHRLLLSLGPALCVRRLLEVPGQFAVLQLCPCLRSLVLPWLHFVLCSARFVRGLLVDVRSQRIATRFLLLQEAVAAPKTSASHGEIRPVGTHSTLLWLRRLVQKEHLRIVITLSSCAHLWDLKCSVGKSYKIHRKTSQL